MYKNNLQLQEISYSLDTLALALQFREEPFLWSPFLLEDLLDADYFLSLSQNQTWKEKKTSPKILYEVFENLLTTCNKVSRDPIQPISLQL